MQFLRVLLMNRLFLFFLLSFFYIAFSELCASLVEALAAARVAVMFISQCFVPC